MSGLAPIEGVRRDAGGGADAPPVRRDLIRPGSQFCPAQFCRAQSCRRKSSSGSGPGEASGRRIKSPNWRGNKQSTAASIEDFGSAEIGQGAVLGADRAHTRNQIRRASQARGGRLLRGRRLCCGVRSCGARADRGRRGSGRERAYPEQGALHSVGAKQVVFVTAGAVRAAKATYQQHGYAYRHQDGDQDSVHREPVNQAKHILEPTPSTESFDCT
jgi:hypothetical protein